MTKVAITTTLLDDLADAISAKTGESTPMSIDDMTDAVEAITLRTSANLSASGATVTVPAGLYSSQATKSVASGSAGTPTATKGTVSNHAVSVTPSVTNTGGYISGGTKTGTAVSVSASELVSGNLAITSNTASGTSLDVTNYATATVNVPAGSNALLITLTWDDDYFGQNEGAWVPDATLAEIVAADSAGKDIYVKTEYDDCPANGFYDDEAYVYCVSVSGVDSSGGPIVTQKGYALTQEGIVADVDYVTIFPVFDSPSVSYTPTESQQTDTVTFDPHNYNGIQEVSVTVGAISSSYVGSGITRRSGNDLTASGATVSVPEGYYASSASKAVSSGTEGTPTVTKGTVSNHAISVTPSVTNAAGYISGGSHTGTAVSVSASELVSGSQTITENGPVDVTNLAEIVVDVSGGGASVQVGYSYGYADAENPSTFSVVDLEGEPTSFVVYQASEIATGTPAKVAAVVFDGTTLHGQTITNTSNAQVSADTGFTKSYSNGDLTITASTAQFVMNRPYYIVYTYGGTAACIDTKDVQVGSGATSITFAGLEDEPLYWSCIFKSNFSTSSGYQRVIYVLEDADGVKGMSMDSSAKYSTSNYSATYSNGSLTISSSGTNAGGYFHQPGYYQLTYAIDATGNYQSKTVTPTTSQQVVQADSGYDALKKVTVNAIPNTYVQPTSTVGATTYRASTSSQTIQAGTYHSAAATIAAVSQTNLDAANIKNGTTVTISNGQSNLWSVTGTYSGGGGTDHLTLIGTKNLGTISTSSTSDTDTGQTMTLTGFDDYDALFCLCHTTTHTNGRHVATARFVFFSATSNANTKTGTAIAGNAQHYKLSNNTLVYRSGTTSYGVYVKAATYNSSANPRSITLTIYQRYNSTSSGTINGTYVLDVYGVKLQDII